MDKELQKRIDAANEEMVNEVDIEEGTTQSGLPPTDHLQAQRNMAHNMPTIQHHGSNPKLKVEFEMVEDSALPAQYKRAKNDSDYYTGVGDKQRATQIKQQYMTDYFLPTVDALVRANSVEAVLANADVLSKLDAYTLLEGTRGAGYTKAYLNSMYEPTGAIERSDAKVRDAVKRINMMVAHDEYRAAIGLAKKIQSEIDRGNNLATSEDYELISRIAVK